ncbi:MAG: response regulator [Verrucomicrobiia bacterium]
MAEKERLKQIHLLVVEDDYDLVHELAEALTCENWVVDTAGNGMEALERMRTADYDAIVCDLMMSRMGGEELQCAVAKEFPYLADHFVFITGQIERNDGISDFIEQTGNTLLLKPFTMEQLRTAVKGVLSC